MTKFPMHTIDETDDPVIRGLLGSMKQKYGGMEPNLFGIMANSPTILKSYIGQSLIFDKSGLSKSEQQLVLLTASVKNQCTYCVPSHSNMAFIRGLNGKFIEAVRAGQEIEDEKMQALRLFTEQVMEASGNVSQDKVSAFLEAGFTKEHVLDVVAGLALVTMANYTNLIADVPLDDPYEMNKWSPDDQYGLPFTQLHSFQ